MALQWLTIDEDETGRINPALVFAPLRPPVGNVRTILLAGEHGFFEAQRLSDSLCMRRFVSLRDEAFAKTTANWVFASNHSRGGRFHSSAAWCKTRYSIVIGEVDPCPHDAAGACRQ